MLRGVKSLLAIGALGAVGVALRWMTAGTITAANTHDLDSLTVLAVGTVAWVAYGWLVLAVLATALEQLPGAIGTAAGVLAARITSTTSRTLLRSALGVAAVTPLTVGVAQAASPHVWPAPQAGAAATWRATEPRSTVQLTAETWRTTEPQSSVEIGNTRTTEPRSSAEIHGTRATGPRSSAQTASSRSTSRAPQPRSTVGIGATRADLHAAEPHSAVERPAGRSNFRATEQRSGVAIDANRTDHRAAGQRSAVEKPADRSNFRATERRPVVEKPAGRSDFRATEPRSTAQVGAGFARSELQAGSRNGVRVGAGVPRPRDGGAAEVRPVGRGADPGVGGVRVPDRPGVGAAARYVDLRSGRVSRVIVAAGETLWDLAARELGEQATDREIGARWPQWYAANRQVIGADPNLIVPGQVLRVPPTDKEQ